MGLSSARTYRRPRRPAANPAARLDRDVLVLGLGNILLSDEGVGVRVIEQLQRNWELPDNIEVLDGGTAGMELLDHLANRDHLIVVDAIKAGHPPGTVMRLSGSAVPTFFAVKISPHQVALADVLAALRLTDEAPHTVTVIGVEPLSLATGLAMTAVVVARIGSLVDFVVAELEALGCAPRPAAAASTGVAAA